MANARGKTIDNTHLSIDTAEDRILIHRDYIAHVFRWTYVARELGRSGIYKTANVLDIGCGVDMPLARMLYSNRFIVNQYVGLEYNKTAKLKTDMFDRGKFPLNVHGGVDFASGQVTVREAEFEGMTGDVLYVNGDVEEGEYELPNVFTCFEMLEHVEPSHSRAVLEKIYHLMLLTEKSVAYISTPCYDPNVGAADNHVNEITRESLGVVLEDIGFEIAENFGTFASQRDYRDNLLRDRPELTRLWGELNRYYDSNVLANIFAPIVPQYARNNIWKLKIASESYQRKFSGLSTGDPRAPWTSSELWRELASTDAYDLGLSNVVED